MIKFRGRGVFRCKDNEYLRANTKNMLQNAKKMLQKAFYSPFFAKDASCPKKSELLHDKDAASDHLQYGTRRPKDRACCRCELPRLPG